MSLLSQLYPTTTPSPTYSGAGGTTLAVQKALAAAQAPAAGATGTAAATGDVSISSAAAEKADNAKDFSTLSDEVRATLDAQYKTAEAAGTKNPQPDLSAMTGRALAAIALNRTGTFSRGEVFAAKSALDQQTRAEFMDAMSNGTSIAAIGSYGAALVSEYDSMSPEEREARGWTESFRNVAQTSSSAGSSSLFDMIDAD